MQEAERHYLKYLPGWADFCLLEVFMEGCQIDDFARQHRLVRGGPPRPRGEGELHTHTWEMNLADLDYINVILLIPFD